MSLQPDGTRGWTQQITPGFTITAAPVIDSEGSVYVVGTRTVQNNQLNPPRKTYSAILYKFLPNGLRIWQQDFPVEFDGPTVTAPPSVWRHQGDEVVMDGYFQEDPEPAPLKGMPPQYAQMMAYLDEQSYRPKLHRWRFNLRTGRTTEQRLDERNLEFGMFNARYAGKPYRYVYSTATVPGWFLFNSCVKHDLRTGESWQITLPDGRYASESPFAPRVNAKDEDDGYLVSFIMDQNTGTGECILIDCKRFADGPVCRIALPHKPCSGTHSVWAPRRLLTGCAAAAGGLQAG